MKGICIGYKGAETVMQAEVLELINAKAVIEDSVVIFDLKDEKELCKLCYLGQSFAKVMLLLDSFEIKKITDVRKDFDVSFLKDRKFRVDCERWGEHEFKSIDVEQELGEHLYEKSKSNVDFKNPDVIVLVYICGNKCYIGLDYAGFDLSKRDYKVYLHPKAMKGITGYIMLRLAGYDRENVLLDPFCGSGVIPIEAAFFSSGYPLNAFRKDKFQFIKMGICDEKYLEQFDKKDKFKGKIHGFDKEMRHLSAAKQNAKIGGVEKSINFSKVSVDWLDTKFEEGEVDLIVTDAPHLAKWNEKQVSKTYEEFFYQAEFVLNKKGKIVLIGNDMIKNAAKKKGFMLEKEITVEKRKQIINIAVFKKEKI